MALGYRLDCVRQLLNPPGARTLDNPGAVEHAMCDITEREVTHFPAPMLNVSDGVCSNS